MCWEVCLFIIGNLRVELYGQLYDEIEERGGFRTLHHYRSQAEKLELRHPSKRHFSICHPNTKMILTAISPTTNLVALVGPKSFWVYRTDRPTPALCHGILEKKGPLPTGIVYSYCYAQD